MTDSLAFSETWFPNQNFNPPELQGYQGHHIMSGQGKGVSLFFRETLSLLSSPIKIKTKKVSTNEYCSHNYK